MIIGRLTRDPELRTTANGTQVASFAVATNLVWKDQNGQKQEKVEYHNIVAWRRLAEICGQYLKKGAKAYIEGRIQTREYMDQSQQKRYFTEIVTENLIMLDRANANNMPGGAPTQNDAPPVPQEPIIDQNTPVGESQNNSDEDEIKVENIPF